MTLLLRFLVLMMMMMLSILMCAEGQENGKGQGQGQGQGKDESCTNDEISSIEIPIIDISGLRNGNNLVKHTLAKRIGQACRDIGFFVITNHGINQSVIDNIWDTTTAFFDLSSDEKMALSPEDQATYPYGYNRMGGEILSAGKDAENGNEKKSLPDLKESFSLGPGNPDSGMPPRKFPTNPPGFEQAWSTYYTSMEELANTLLQAFAVSLDLNSNFFEGFVDKHASAIRALNYPIMDKSYCASGYTRASAHTDYGTLTILRSGGPGLQVAKDTNPPTWVDVPHVEDGFVINLGDLMRRWTNNQWLSTLHQVVNPESCNEWTRRQSIAFFHNVNNDAVVSAIPGTGDPLYETIIAGDFLMKKHLAATAGYKGYTE